MDEKKDDRQKEIENLNKKLGIKGDIDTSEEAKAVIDGQMGFEEYLESIVDGETVEEKVSAKRAAKEKILVTAGLGKNLIRKSVDTVMHESMIPYSEYVIMDRALPRVEDGLKPVQRRILFTMHELGISPEKPHLKSARIVGECLGKYHPHGDRSVYDAMVRMAQSFNMSETLVDGHGNFGSVDGDSAAAMRYTEARMTPLALEMLRDLDKDTVEWNFNFDDSLKEPATLPSRYPNLLVNGASGIAVGLATNIPPHNISEVIAGVIAYIDNKNITLDEMMQIIKGPDFPTGGFVIASDELKKAYETGRGRLLLRAKIHIEKAEYDKRSIVITELPYQVNKANLLTKILDLREKKKDLLSGISDITDESDRNGMRAVIKVKKDVDPARIADVLYKYTDLQTTFGVNTVAIAGGRPQQMGLMDIIAYYTDYQRDVVLRRSKYELGIAKEREHILDGLVIAITNIDEVIAIIKKAENPAEAKVKLRERFILSDKQAQAVLDTRLARLTSLEVFKLKEELEELKKQIVKLTAIIGSKKIQLKTVKTELLDVAKRFKTERRTEILGEVEEYVVSSEKELRTAENVVIGITKGKTIKSMTQKHCKASNTDFSERTNEFDSYIYLLETMSDKQLMAFSNLGNAFRVSASDVPDFKWRDKGILFSSFENEAQAGEYPIAIFEIPEKLEGELLFFSKNGMVKRTAWSEYNLQKNYFQAVRFKDDDLLVSVETNTADTTIVFVTEKGQVLNAEKSDIPLQGRISGGVRGINLSEKDEIVFVGQAKVDDKIVLLSDRCFGKRVEVSEIEPIARYRKGVKVFDLKAESGKKLMFAGLVNAEEVFDIVIVDGLNIMSCYSTEVFEVQSRVTKGKSLVKNKKGMGIKEATKYLTVNY